MYNHLQKTSDNTGVPSESLQYIDGKTFLVVFSVSFRTHSFWLKPVRNQLNSLSQDIIIFAKRFVAHEGFPISPTFRGRRKEKRLLILYYRVALGNTNKGTNSSVAIGNYFLKAFLFWGRQLSLKWWSLIPAVFLWQQFYVTRIVIFGN